MDETAQRRKTGTEQMLRRVNDAIDRGQWPGEEDARTTFRCECAERLCNRMLELTPAEYERVRAHPRRFVVLPGHERPDIEVVVETQPGYVVVEKRPEVGRAARDAGA